MIKRKMIRKIIVTTTALFALLLIYLIPKDSNNYLNGVKQELEYVEKNVIKSPIFLMDAHGHLGRTMVAVASEEKEIEARARELLTILIRGGASENKIPNGFQALIPTDTKLLSVGYENNVLKINFSKELLDVNQETEEKMVEAIVYTVTSIDQVKQVILYVEGNILSKLPKSGINLPSTLSRTFGINKEYDITGLQEINQVTVYYVDKYNDQFYYVPVTKYLNDSRDKIKIIVDALSSGPMYNSNLMSFLNSNARLIEANQNNDMMELNFNAYIFSDFDTKKVLEEVLYTISLSVEDNYDVSGVVIAAEKEEIYKTIFGES